ncbi:MAG: glycoside hydrolase family 1 protein [Candidatus Omnitrophota bacterium]
MIQFPKDFFWGAATSSHQIEGHNVHNDWWEWERRLGLKESSGEACRSYELFREDFDFARHLRHNAHRLSIEWSRIEPKENEFSSEELTHYRDVILALKERQLEPIVTLHHFTNPAWLARAGGWLNRKSSFYFLRYVERLVDALGDQVRYWATINEPLVYAYHAYVLGVWPPQEKSLWKARTVVGHMARAHIGAYRLIHRIYKKRNLSRPMVSFAKNMQAFETCTGTWKNNLGILLRHRYYNLSLIRKLAEHRALDYIGVNYYSRSLVDTKSWRLSHLLIDTCNNNCSRLKKNSLGWDVYPQGLYDLLLTLRRFDLPVFILENGICTDDDGLRWEFIQQHLKALALAMEKGIKGLGYLYWSLIDNYEWDKGFGPRFGLIDIDYPTYRRTVRESAEKFSRVCETSKL